MALLDENASGGNGMVMPVSPIGGYGNGSCFGGDGCCTHISVENVSAPATAGGVAPAINVQNALLRVRRTA